jgi:hypothetical protein
MDRYVQKKMIQAYLEELMDRFDCCQAAAIEIAKGDHDQAAIEQAFYELHHRGDARKMQAALPLIEKKNREREYQRIQEKIDRDIAEMARLAAYELSLQQRNQRPPNPKKADRRAPARDWHGHRGSD